MKFLEIIQFRLIAVFLIAIVCFLSSYTNDNEEFLTQDQWVEAVYSKMTLDERIAQLFLVEVNEDVLNQANDYVVKNKVGGLIFNNPSNKGLQERLKKYQNSSKIPLFIGLKGDVVYDDSYSGQYTYPSVFTLSVSGDKRICEINSKFKSLELLELGVNLDLNINASLQPLNGDKYFDRFGDNPLIVSRLIGSTVKGKEEVGMVSTVSQFPGLGNLSEGGKKELDIVKDTKKSLDAVALLPFREAIKNGASLVVMSHTSVPSIDSSLTPMCFSRLAYSFLNDSLNFKGLVVVDRLDDRKLLNSLGKENSVLASLKAGANLIVQSDDVSKTIKLIELAVLNNELDMSLINEKCLAVLKLKYQKIISSKFNKVSTKVSLTEKEWGKKEAYEKGFVVLKNSNSALPLSTFDKKYIHISIGPHTSFFSEGMNRYDSIPSYNFYTIDEARERMNDILYESDHVILTIHQNNYGEFDGGGVFSKVDEWFSQLPQSLKKSVVLFAKEKVLLKSIEMKSSDAFVISFQNNSYSQERLSQFVVGAIPSVGKIPYTVSSSFVKHQGVDVAYGGRLKYTFLEEFGVKEQKLAKIDSIVAESIRNKVFPGCQIFVAVDGKILYNKSFGKPMYADTVSVANDNLYDIASVTKVAASTIALMHLESQGRVDMNKRLKDYLPELMQGSNLGDIVLKDMMTHQAGLPAWIPFYLKTIKNGKLDSALYSSFKKPGFENQVAKDLWVINSYSDSIYKKILRSKLESKSYKYSDLGYYFVNKIVEKETNQAFDKYLNDSIYKPMGLNSICFNPLTVFPINQIMPTEDDKSFRGQVVRGYVHDPGSALMGGVGGHAGLFANATDLGALMQMVLNNGNYGNVSYLDSAVVKKYTSCQFCVTNRRGLGFDRPTKSGGGTCDKVASSQSYGHSGFTGTLVWSDPKYNINYVFLSNRVYPSAENWKIVEQNVRTNIQKAIYEAVFDANTRVR